MTLSYYRIFPAAFLITLLVNLHSTAAFAACNTIIPTECAGDPAGTCTCTGTWSVDNLCDLDFSGYDVTLTSSCDLDFGANAITLEAKSLTINGSGKLRGTDGSVVVTLDDNLTVDNSGRLETLNTPNGPGSIVVTADCITVNGIVRAEANSQSDSPGGNLELYSTASGCGIDFNSGSTLSVKGQPGTVANGSAFGGTLVLSAVGFVDVVPQIDVSGGWPDGATIEAGDYVTLTGGIAGQATFNDGNDGASIAVSSTGGAITISGTTNLNGNGGGASACNNGGGGALDITSETSSVTIGGITANGNGGGNGGQIDVSASTDVVINGGITLEGGTCTGGGAGWGGVLNVAADTGDVTVSSSMSLDGKGDGAGGDIDITAGDAVSNSATMTANGGGSAGGFGGTVHLDGRSVTVGNQIKANGRDGSFTGGGIVSMTAIDDIAINANVQASGTANGDDGGQITLTAGTDNSGNVTVSNPANVSADAGGCASGGSPCGYGGLNTFTACDVTVASGAKVTVRGEGTADELHGVNRFTAHDDVATTGSNAVDARKQTNGTTNGKNIIKYKDTQSVAAGSTNPTATVTQDTTLTACN